MRSLALLTPLPLVLSLFLLPGCSPPPVADNAVVDAEVADENGSETAVSAPPPQLAGSETLATEAAELTETTEAAVETTTVEPVADDAAEESPAVAEIQDPATDEASAPSEPTLAPATPQASETVLLGTGDLTSGIPGEGPLTVSEIEQWLDNPANHTPLNVQLPLGLAAGSQSIFIPEDNPMTRAKIELGRQLYFDRRLSVDGTISCAD